MTCTADSDLFVREERMIRPILKYTACDRIVGQAANLC